MKCPFCASEDTQVKDSRPAEEGAAIRRRRSCNACGARFTTFERVQLRELLVLKASGKKVPFDREKLHHSISVAARKRDLAPELIDRTVSNIIRRLESQGENEVPSAMIGEEVMAALKQIDDVAFVRYASVYRNFTEATDFEGFLRSMDDHD